MKHSVVAPSVGESISEVSILKWAKNEGEIVKKGDVLLEIESDKATVEVVAEADGVLHIVVPQGTTIPIGAQVAEIDSEGKATQTTTATSPPKSASSGAGASHSTGGTGATGGTGGTGATSGKPLSPAVQKLVTENPVNLTAIQGTGKDGRITKGDVLQQMAGGGATVTNLPVSPSRSPTPKPMGDRAPDKATDRRVPMTKIRQKIAERLVMAQRTAAILTTFNEVDMSPVMAVRNSKKDAFKTKHGVALSFMSFFTRGVVEALKLIPAVNASIDGTDVIYHDQQDIGIAVGTERGLVVPVIRDAGHMGFVDLEKAMAAVATKAREGKLSIADMTGGTFTISNGGVYGSMLSTPILNPPQSGILGMHNIINRPVVVGDQIVARPMMYLALSYDHRMIDGKEAVTFLVTLRDFLEHPEKLGLESLNV